MELDMNSKSNILGFKKLLTTLAVVSGLASSASAGAIIDVEVGGGMWATDVPTGKITTSGVDVDLTNQANLGETSDNMYMWAVLDHPIPIVPNIRIERVSLKSAGNTNFGNIPSGLGFTGSPATVATTLDLSNTDVIAYWGVPFATWLPFMDEVDFGLGVKAFNGSLMMQDNVSATAAVNTSFDGAVVPYAYGKLRVKPPFMLGVGLEAELKYIESTDGVEAKFSEMILKADWGFVAPLPLLDIEAGLEAGYRSMSLNVDSSELKTDIEFNGIFFGLYGKFGI